MSHVRQITLELDHGNGRTETVTAAFHRHGWEQWGAPVTALSLTTPLLDALADLIAEDDELRALLVKPDPDDATPEEERA